MSYASANYNDPGAAPLSRWAMVLMVALILMATLIRGGNRGVALIALEWLALGTALALAIRWLGSGQGPLASSTSDRLALWLLLLSPVWLPAIQALTGRVSVPTATGFTAMAGVPLAVCLLVGWAANGAQGATLRRLWLGVSLAQAMFGLVQLTGADALFFGMDKHEPVIGTYASKNTYANLLVMAIPLAVLELMSSLGDKPRRQGNKALWGWCAAVFVLVVTVMLTTSRTGIVTGLMALVLSVALLAPRKAGSRWGAWGWSVGLVGLVVVALMTGGQDWAARFDADRLAFDYDIRALMRDAVAGAAWSGMPLGSGLGSFPWVSSAFQPPEMGRFWFDLAHNDYLQLLVETGLAGAFLIACALWLYVRRGVFWLRRPGSREARAALAAAIGLLAFGLHAWVDYPFHIPANAMMAATLLGLMCRHQSAETHTEHPR